MVSPPSLLLVDYRVILDIHQAARSRGRLIAILRHLTALVWVKWIVLVCGFNQTRGADTIQHGGTHVGSSRVILKA